jgi:hypothetical protein
MCWIWFASHKAISIQDATFTGSSLYGVQESKCEILWKLLTKHQTITFIINRSRVMSRNDYPLNLWQFCRVPIIACIAFLHCSKQNKNWGRYDYPLNFWHSFVVSSWCTHSLFRWRKTNNKLKKIRGLQVRRSSIFLPNILWFELFFMLLLEFKELL